MAKPANKNDHKFYGSRQYLEPLAWYVHSVMRQCPDDELASRRLSAKELSAQFMEVYLGFTLEILIQCDIEPTVENIANAAGLNGDEAARVLSGLVASGYFTAEKSKLGPTDKVIRRGDIDQQLGQKAEANTVRLLSRYWGDDIDDELQNRFERTTGRAPGEFSISKLSRGQKRYLGRG